MSYLCCMRKKSDIIFRRLNRDFNLVSYGSIVGAPKNRFIGNNDLVMVKRGDRTNEIYLHINRYEIRLSPSFHSRHFDDCSLPYFKKHLKSFITNCSGNDYGSYRMVLYASNEELDVSFGGIHFKSDVAKIAASRLRRNQRGQMYVAWKNPNKVSRRRSNHLRIVI